MKRYTKSDTHKGEGKGGEIFPLTREKVMGCRDSGCGCVGWRDGWRVVGMLMLNADAQWVGFNCKPFFYIGEHL